MAGTEPNYYYTTMAEPEPTSEPEPAREPEPEPEYISSYPESEPVYPENVTGLLPEEEVSPEGEPYAKTISDPDTMKIMAAISGIMAAAIIVENLIVFFVILRAWPKQNPTITYFIIHLACADLTSGFQFLWFNCIDVLLQITHDGVWVLVLCGIWMVTIAASIGGIVNFAHLRINALKSAMKNEKYSKRRAIICIVLSWLLPILVLFVPPIAGWNCVYATAEEKKSGTECSQAVFPFTKIYVLLLVTLLFTAIVWITVAYIWIFALVHKRLRAVRAMSTQSKSKDTERQLFNTMAVIISIFFVCHFPVGVVLIFDYITTAKSAAVVDAFQITLTISFLNSLLNPIIYYWRMPATKDSFWIAFGQRDRTQNKQHFSSAASFSKKNDRVNTLSIMDIESPRLANKNHVTTM